MINEKQYFDKHQSLRYHQSIIIKKNMKRLPTIFLRFFIVILAALSLILAIFMLPSMWQGAATESPNLMLNFPLAFYAIRLIVIGLYATLLPFYWVLWQSLKFLNYIDKNQAFSAEAVKTLRNIKYGAGVMAILYVGGIPLLLPIAEADDAPGMLFFGAAIACFPIAVTAFASVLERLFGGRGEM
jgi:hypothetical protein